jgi:uncharacterized protein Veg
LVSHFDIFLVFLAILDLHVSLPTSMFLFDLFNCFVEIQREKQNLEYPNWNTRKKTGRRTDKEKAEVLANVFSSVFTNEPDGEIPNIEPITIEHDCLEKSFKKRKYWNC